MHHRLAAPRPLPRTTADGRIAIGRGGGAIGAAGRFGTTSTTTAASSEGVAAACTDSTIVRSVRSRTHGQGRSTAARRASRSSGGPTAARTSSTGTASRATVSARASSAGVSSLRSRSTVTTAGRRRPSATASSAASRRSPCASSAALVREAVHRKEAIEDKGRAMAKWYRISPLSRSWLLQAGPEQGTEGSVKMRDG